MTQFNYQGYVLRRVTARRTLEMVSAGLHCSFKMSRQMLPWLLMLGWYTCSATQQGVQLLSASLHLSSS